MEFYTEALTSLIQEFERLPGIGKKTAERLAYYVLRVPKDDAMKLAHAIRDVKQNVRNCRVCFSITEAEVCQICADPRRDAGIICVVEQPKDLYVIEQARSFNGHYHVLMGVFSPLDGVTPADLTIRGLMQRVRDRSTPTPVREIILATNLNFEGDGTALYLAEQLKEFPDLKVSRIARGMPSGSNLEHASGTIIADALEGRRSMDSAAPRMDRATGAEDRD
jgi:recombination protein RecR